MDRLADPRVRTWIDGRATELRQKVEEAKQALQRLKDSQQAAWNENKNKVNRAIADSREGYRKAIAEFKDTNAV
jgi:hypothetical protein